MNNTSVRVSSGSERASGLPPIENPYLLVSHIPFFKDRDGHLHTDRLWLLDLKEHLPYLKNFTIACPLWEQPPPEGCVPLESDPSCASLRFVALPGARSSLQAAAFLPVTLRTLWAEVRRADIVHSGIGGWPFPPAWIATPLARLLGRRSVIIVESAPWRLQPGLPASIKARASAFVFERLGRLCLKHSDLAIFTADEYRKSLLRERLDEGRVIHASWINEENILLDDDARNSWKHKATVPVLKVLFAGQLKAGKGVPVLLEALRKLAQKEFPLELDILGAGELKPDCERAKEELKGATKIQLLGTVPYGPDFFRLLREYHAVVVPSISDEQPRIVYDAFSQAVPILATRTAGLVDCVRDEQTGWFVEPNDDSALSALLERAAAERPKLEVMGLAALRSAHAMTHRSMHHTRHRLLIDLLASSSSDPRE